MSKEKNILRKRTWKRDFSLHMMMLIPVVVLFIFRFIPMFGIIIAFEDFNPAKGFFESDFVGLKHFRNLFSTPNFLNSLKNTVIIALGKIILSVVVPVGMALLLNEMKNMHIKKSIQTMIYLPHFVSWVIMSGIIVEILSPRGGLVNQFLGIFGVEPIYFLGSNLWFRPIIWLTDIWKEAGYATIVYLAALAGVDETLYEAAALDGAGHFKRVVYVTFPCILPTIILMTTLKMGSILNAGFDQIFNLYSPVTYETGDIIDTLVYRLGLGGGQFSLASAAGLFKSVISGMLLVASYKIAHKLSGYKVL